MSKPIGNRLDIEDHPGSLKAIMSAPPTSATTMARILKQRTESRRRVEDKKLERSLFGKEFI